MVRKGKGRAVKAARKKYGASYESDDLKLAPHTMVIKRGIIDQDTRELITNLRKVMEPYTAASLKVTKKNTLKDFVSIAGPMHVTHLIILSQTELGDYMKFIRLPRGPTIHFKLLEYSTSNDVLNTMKKKHTHKKQYLHQPLLVINGFNVKDKESGQSSMEPHHKLLTTTLQNMFPSINVTKVNLDAIRRCVMFNYNKEDNTIDFRQYNIRLAPMGLSKPVKKLNQEKLPDLSNYQDISEYIEKGGLMSDSEMEDGPDNQVEIKQEIHMRGATNLSGISAIRLAEIGPRMKLRLAKIEEGICDGEVMYHESITKTPEQVQATREKLNSRKKADKIKEKEKYDRKEAAAMKEKNKTKSGKDKKTRENLCKYENPKDTDYDEVKENREYYRQELGEEPEDEFDGKSKHKKREREENDPNAEAKLLKTSGYEEYLNETKRDTKKFKSSSNGGESENKKFGAKFEKRAGGGASKPAKFLKFSNKKTNPKSKK